MNGCRTSPTAGRPLWHRTTATGSSLPTYFPAQMFSFSVLTTHAGPMFLSLLRTFLMAYLVVSPIRLRMS